MLHIPSQFVSQSASPIARSPDRQPASQLFIQAIRPGPMFMLMMMTQIGSPTACKKPVVRFLGRVVLLCVTPRFRESSSLQAKPANLTLAQVLLICQRHLCHLCRGNDDGHDDNDSNDFKAAAAGLCFAFVLDGCGLVCCHHRSSFFRSFNVECCRLPASKPVRWLPCILAAAAIIVTSQLSAAGGSMPDTVILCLWLIYSLNTSALLTPNSVAVQNFDSKVGRAQSVLLGV